MPWLRSCPLRETRQTESDTHFHHSIRHFHRKDPFLLPLITPVALISRMSTGSSVQTDAVWPRVCHLDLGG